MIECVGRGERMRRFYLWVINKVRVMISGFVYNRMSFFLELGSGCFGVPHRFIRSMLFSL